MKKHGLYVEIFSFAVQQGNRKQCRKPERFTKTIKRGEAHSFLVKNTNGSYVWLRIKNIQTR